MRIQLAVVSIYSILLVLLSQPAFGQQGGGGAAGDTVGEGFGPSSVLQDAAAGETFGGFSGVLDEFRQEGRQFVGATTEDVRGAMSAMGADIGAGQGSPSRFSPQQRRGTTGQGGRGSGRSQTTIRSTLRLGYGIALPERAALGSTLTKRFEKVSRLGASSPEVSFEKGTAILRGSVQTERDRVLAGRLAQLEPGVRRVENQLTVAPSSVGPASKQTVQ